MTEAPLPFRPRDWVDDGSGRVARVKRVYRDRGEVLLDLVIYDREGNKVGRDSPAMGGPRTFEPCCPGLHWCRITEPVFPLRMVWVPDGDGKKKTARFMTGKPLPPAKWTPPQRRGGGGLRFLPDDKFRKALEAIAAGHNDARALAVEVLGEQR